MGNEDFKTEPTNPNLVTPEEVERVGEVYRQLGISKSPAVSTPNMLEPMEVQLQRLGGLRYQGFNFTISSSS